MHLYHNSAESSRMSTKNAAQSTAIKIGMRKKSTGGVKMKRKRAKGLVKYFLIIFNTSNAP